MSIAGWETSDAGLDVRGHWDVCQTGPWPIPCLLRALTLPHEAAADDPMVMACDVLMDEPGHVDGMDQDNAPHVAGEDGMGSEHMDSDPAPNPYMTCRVPDVHIGPWTITEVTLLPFCIAALVIGVYVAKRCMTLPRTMPRRLYASPFWLFGIMMTTAMVVHCFAQDWHNRAKIVAIFVDVFLTTCVAAMMGLIGVADLLGRRSVPLYAPVMLVALLASWWVRFFQAPHRVHAPYFVTILIGCPLFLAGQVAYVLRHHHAMDKHAARYLTIGGVAGAFGVLSCFAYPLVCRLLGQGVGRWFGGQFLWFMLSDVAMAAVGAFMVHTRQRVAAKAVQEREDMVRTLLSSYEKV